LVDGVRVSLVVDARPSQNQPVRVEFTQRAESQVGKMRLEQPREKVVACAVEPLTATATAMAKKPPFASPARTPGCPPVVPKPRLSG
jgi:hypothetical protein